MNKFILFTLIYSTAIIGCTGQETSATEKAESFLKERYKNIQNLSWEQDDEGNLEGQFKSDGTTLRADFTQGGEWIETEESVDWEDLPEAVKNAVEESYDKDDITEIERVEHNSRGEFYDIEFKDSGKNEDVEFDMNGKRIN